MDMIKKLEIFVNNDFLFQHSLAVAKTAKELAEKNHADSDQAFIAGLLHDIGGIYPNNERVKIAEKLGIELLKEELEFPLIIHQKISKLLAKIFFGVLDENTLNAIECHTTLRANFTELDLIVFLADKISWDGGDNAPFKKVLNEALETSLEAAALAYIDFIIDEGLKVVHPWLLEAREQLLELKQLV